uniref:Sec1 family domain containing 2 n=1 Tax=Electrophorus electricus TaxID=8005 RepID=A0AAY5F183_ELEEL
MSAGAARFPARLWEEVLRRGRHAVVFMDDPCAESLHWSGGVSRLLEAGARNVKQLSSFEAGAEDEPRALFVVSTLLKGRTADVIKDVVSLSRFRCCVVVTAMPHSLHLLAGGVTAELDGSPVFQQFEERLREWMGDASCTAEVVHVPVVFAQLSPQLLLVPSFADLFPLLETDLRSIDGNRPEKRRHGRPMDVDVHALPLALQVKVKALASALNALFELSGTREESFAVGPMSRMIAGELASQAKAGRKAAVHKASVVFIDRTLDLTGAVGHHGDNLVEKILSVLPQLPGHVTDVQVDMVGLTHLQHTPTVQGTLAPGCLAQNQSATARLLWETMLVAKQKEAVMEVRRHLVEAASKENLPFKINLGRVTSEQLSSYAQLFRGSWGALQSHCGVLQLGLATAQTLRPAGLARWDARLAFEKLLLQALGDSGLADVLKQLLTIVKSSGSGSGAGGGDDELSVDDLLVLLVYVYSLGQETHVGRSHAEEQVEEELIGALTRSLTNQTTLSQLLQDITGVSTPEELTVERAHTALERVFETLRTLGHSRSQLRQFRSVYNAGDTTHQATYRPFLKQVLEEIFRPGRPECPDIEHTSGGLTDLLKTGISMFMKVSRPHPSDHPLLFLFLVGGVTPSELRLIREVVSAHKAGTQVLVISTRLLRPADIPHLLFGTGRLTPDIGV